MGCHLLLQGIFPDQGSNLHLLHWQDKFFITKPSGKSSVSVTPSTVLDSLAPHGLQLARLLCPWNSPGKNTGVGCNFILQGIFPTQGSNLDLLHCRQILYHLSHQGSPELVFNAKVLLVELLPRGVV